MATNFKLNLQSVSGATADENYDPMPCYNFSMSKNSLLRDTLSPIHPHTIQANLRESPSLFNSAPHTRNHSGTFYKLLNESETRVDYRSPDTSTEAFIPIDHHAFYGSCTSHQKKRKISNLDESLDPLKVQLTESVNDFLKKSTEIEQELRRYSATPPPGMSSYSTKDDTLEDLKALLVKNGYADLPTEPDFKMLELRLYQVLCDLDRSRLNAFNLCKSINENITERDKDVFSKLFLRPCNMVNLTEQALIKVIAHYENKVNNESSEVKSLKKSLAEKQDYIIRLESELSFKLSNKQREFESLEKVFKDYKESMRSTQSQLETLKEEKLQLIRDKQTLSETLDKRNLPSDTLDYKKITDEVCSILSLRGPQNIIKAVQKLERVLRAVPKLEKFIREVCILVFPELKHERNTKKCTKSMEDVIPTLQKWIEELGILKNSRNPSMESGRMFTVSDEAVAHFRNLYRIDDSVDIFDAINRTFIFTSEMKNFVRTLKSHLQLPADASLCTILLHIRAALEGYYS
jgi:hypothetical protein